MLKAHFQKDIERQKRRERLTRHEEVQGFSSGYSLFVRSMRILLPVTALIIIAVLFTTNGMRDKPVIPTQEEAKVAPVMGKNELINPHFESVDKKNQPYMIDALRAVQGEGEGQEQLVLLEQPKGQMSLESGQKAYLEADHGAYRQDVSRIFLEGKVKLRHDNGYTLNTEKLNVDLDQSLAWSDTDVTVAGPDGTIDAKGFRANNQSGLLEFTGPAKMTIKSQTLKGFNIGGT